MKFLKFSVLHVFLIAIVMFAASPVLADDPFTGTKFYLSHISGTDSWETEIAVLNPTSSAAAAILISYDNSGQTVGQAVSISLPAHGRYQAKVCNAFTNAENIGYIVLTSDVFGLDGYCRFNNGEMGASFMASYPSTFGRCCTKIEEEGGWTGIILINTALVSANITLTAYNDSGVVVAVQSMQLGGGCKFISIVQSIFTQSIDAATYVSYASDQEIVSSCLSSFDLNQSATYQDGYDQGYLEGMDEGLNNSVNTIAGIIVEGANGEKIINGPVIIKGTLIIE